MNAATAFRRAPRAAGFSLLEVLVSMIILSIGLLGLAALQAFSIKANQSANYRTQATALAYDLLDRMRANRNELIAGRYFTNYGSAPGSCPDTGGTPPSTGAASRDVYDWKCAIKAQLPLGEGAVRMPGGTVVVAIRWTDARWSNGADATTEFTLTSAL
ncbi:MAG TPA: type IV pilus modification protein PilV [Tahibacter sp.]|uniref:type IV pilus modification protein PilV n=1 Tax=Tahibacter sp. TaxID=2056211 RepID=UPI002BB9351C|nr:type IV pilus modification protein PilV [Tahibacter sp.]HSX59410.1 type IV pilus modification protein PilV [Tahibacter sp.]